MNKISDKEIEDALKINKSISIGILNHKLTSCFLVNEERTKKINELKGWRNCLWRLCLLGYLNNEKI